MIHHVGLEVAPAHGAACLAFWALLGFEEVAPPPSLAARAAWVERDGRQVHLLWADDPVVPPQGHVALVEPDLDAAVARLAAAGHPVGRRTAHWGAARAVARCPQGHRVELAAAPPPAGRRPGLGGSAA